MAKLVTLDKLTYYHSKLKDVFATKDDLLALDVPTIEEATNADIDAIFTAGNGE